MLFGKGFYRRALREPRLRCACSINLNVEGRAAAAPPSDAHMASLNAQVFDPRRFDGQEHVQDRSLSYRGRPVILPDLIPLIGHAVRIRPASGRGSFRNKAQAGAPLPDGDSGVAQRPFD